MTAQLDVGKVAFGGFLVPWWNKGAFSRALAIPLVALVTVTLSFYFAREHLPELSSWLLYVTYGALFALFAVTCHRLVLLDQRSVAARFVPTLIFNLGSSWFRERNGSWFGWTVAAARIPALYLFARLCLVFPVIAVERKVSLKWSWNLTRNNGWRLFVIVAVLPWILSQGVALLYRSDPTVVETVALAFLGCALFAIEVAALSLSYLELTKEEAPPA